MSTKMTKGNSSVQKEDPDLQTFQIISDDDSQSVIIPERRKVKDDDFKRIPQKVINPEIFKGIAIGIFLAVILFVVEFFYLKK